MSEQVRASVDVTIPNTEGLHARPVMSFVDLASKYAASVKVMNLTGRAEPVDGKSAMQMMLLEGTQGCVLRIEATGHDANDAVQALERLVKSGFNHQTHLDAGS